MTQSTTSDDESPDVCFDDVATAVMNTFEDAIEIILEADVDDLNYDWMSFLDEWFADTNADETSVYINHESGAFIRIFRDQFGGFNVMTAGSDDCEIPQRSLSSVGSTKHDRDDAVNHAVARMIAFSRNGEY